MPDAVFRLCRCRPEKFVHIVPVTKVTTPLHVPRPGLPRDHHGVHTDLMIRHGGRAASGNIFLSSIEIIPALKEKTPNITPP
jgi:hypothetical protein